MAQVEVALRRGAAASAIVEADEVAKRRRPPMIRIAITQAAFEAIARMLTLGSAGYENETKERGERYVCWTTPWSAVS